MTAVRIEKGLDLGLVCKRSWEDFIMGQTKGTEESENSDPRGWRNGTETGSRGEGASLGEGTKS